MQLSGLPRCPIHSSRVTFRTIKRRVRPQPRAFLLAIYATAALFLCASPALEAQNASAATGPSVGAVAHLPIDTNLQLPSEIDHPEIEPPGTGGITGAVADAAHNASKVPPKYNVDKIGDRGVGGGLNLYSLEREQALGRELAGQVEMRTRLINDPIVTQYVNRVAQTIVRNSDAKVPFTVRVIDDDSINAFALPGGFFYVNSGLVLAADNEAELAGVMAHEIAHVAARHATKNATRSQIFNMASIPLIFMGGPAGYAIRQVAGLAVPMSFLKFSRDAEREADLLGLEYIYAAGYDPAEFVHFFETLRVKEKQKASFVAKAFSTHPLTDERIRRAQQEISTMLPSRDEYIVTTSDFDEVKSRLAGLENLHRIDGGKTERPVLRKRGPDDKDKGGNDGPVLRKRY